MADPIVETVAGKVRGRPLPGGAGGAGGAFLGIPYAAAPFGPLRFQAPAPVEKWDGVRDARSYGPTVPKGPGQPPFDTLVPDRWIEGTDCLNLNVWTPDVGAAGLPVYVWIHGGAFVGGTGALALYDGSAFARDGVVCVTLNYRLGVDGFAHLAGAPANRGLLDQVAALEWVAENIAAFGGDAGKVTIGGESAGAMSACSLLSMPRAAGLFRGVIAQSGAGHHATTLPTAERVAAVLAEQLGVSPAADAVAALPLDRLLAAQQAVSLDVQANRDPERWAELVGNQMAFEPVIDGEVLEALPIERLGDAAPEVRVLTGTNADEMRLFIAAPGLVDYVDDHLLVTTAAGLGLEQDQLDAYWATRADALPGDVLCDVMGDWFFRIPAIRVAEARPTGSSWLYEFAWPSPAMNGRLGSCHFADVPFTFDTLAADGATWLAGDNPPADLAMAMHAAWVRFIADGDPGWRAYEPGRRATMVFDDGRSGVVDDPWGDERRLWEGRR